MNKEKHKSKLNMIMAAFILTSFVLLIASLVWSKGVCCGDDAYLALIAKNLAGGYGYSSTVQPYVGHYTLLPFDPLVGTGPTIILPAALVIRIFGNTYWAPGFSNIILWSLALFCIGYMLRRYGNGLRFVLFTFGFLFLNIALMPYHFEEWYSLLGEVPATLFIILGILSFLDGDNRKHQITSGIFFSLAIQAKVLSAIALIVFLFLYAVITFLRAKKSGISSTIKEYLKKTSYILFGFVTPLVLFELWKLRTLGLSGYVDNWREYFLYLGNDSVGIVKSATILTLYSERLQVIMERFGILLPYILPILLLSWLMIKDDSHLRQVYIFLLAIVIAYSIWWIFLSIGWPRYYIIALIILLFTISLPLLSSRPKGFIAVYFLLLIILTSNNWQRIKYPFENYSMLGFKPSTQTQALIETTHYLSEQVADGGRIATQWWATASDLEYMMETSLNFTTTSDLALYEADSFWLAVNSKFINRDIVEFTQLLDNCESSFEMDIYSVYRCPSTAYK